VAWLPLHIRMGMEEEPYPGIPKHLRAPLWGWVAGAFKTPAGRPLEDHMLYISAMARLPLTTGSNGHETLRHIEGCCHGDEIQFLSVIDALLNQTDPSSVQRISKLEELLLIGNSAWAVAPDRKSLTSRVDPTAAEAVAQAVAPHDAASDELAEAWRKAYGREPDPSDAWDHSIKAVEHILKPVVCSSNAVATLGKIVGDLRSQPQLWKLVLPGKPADFSVAPLVAMLDVIWPNPDRHGSGTPVMITLDQAHAVVHLAVTVVQWGRAGVLQRVP
jgi:hypothetical protein